MPHPYRGGFTKLLYKGFCKDYRGSDGLSTHGDTYTYILQSYSNRYARMLHKTQQAPHPYRGCFAKPMSFAGNCLEMSTSEKESRLPSRRSREWERVEVSF